MNYYTLTNEEGKIVQDFDKNEFVSVKDKGVKKQYAEYAHESLSES